MLRAVFVDCTPEIRKAIVDRRLPIPPSVSINFGNPGSAELVALGGNADVLFVEHTVISPGVFEACPSIKAVVLMGREEGTYLDLADAARRGVTVLTIPPYGARAVAEHALALMFAAARKIAVMDRNIRSGAWNPVGGTQLVGRKVAVIGLGETGSSFAEMTAAIGMRVVAWNPTPMAHPAFVAELDEALSGAAVVSLHLALSSLTAGLIDTHRLSLPAPGFILVNTAHAQLLDEATLLSGLASGRIGHAALDVFAEEPLLAHDPYLLLSNVTLTAHAALMTDATYAELWSLTLRAYETLQGRK